MFAESIKNEGQKAIFVMANMASEVDIDILVNKTVETYGKVDILVNNAGISGGLSFLATDDSSYVHGASFEVDGGYTIF